MGVCAATAGDATNYEQITSTTDLVNDNNNNELSISPLVNQSSVSNDDKKTLRRKAYKNYRIGITQSYIYDIQKLLYSTHITESKSFYRIPSSITSMILRYLPTYFRIYGIGKNLLSNNELSEFERLNIFETKLSSLNNIYRGHNKYFIKSYISEIYGIGNNCFDGLCLNNTENTEINTSFNFNHIRSFYKYFNFVDLNEEIEMISNSIFSNDIIIKLKNGSIYISSLTMDDINGEWKRIFYKPSFNDLSMNKHLSIIAIECGLLHSLLLANNGTVYSFGANNNGQCGLGYLSDKEMKIKIITSFIEEKVTITSINCGQHHSVAIDNNGNLWCFGYNKNGQCSSSLQVGIKIIKPMMIYNIDASERIIKAECGETFTVYLDENGYYGGFGKIIVSTLDRVNITEWDTKDLSFKDLSCGSNHVILIGKDNQIYTHGSNEYFKSGLKIGRAGKPTKVKNDMLPQLQPCKVLAGMHSSIIIYNYASQ